MSEPEPEIAEERSERQKKSRESGRRRNPADEDRVAQAEEKLNSLKAALIKAKQKLMDLDSDFEALEQQQNTEIEVITRAVGRRQRRTDVAHLKKHQGRPQGGTQEAQGKTEDKQKTFKAEIKRLEKQIPQAEYELKLLSNRGKLELILDDADLIGTLKERWIAAEVAKRLDYPIFMAVSERGGQRQLRRL